ncbi:polysaccharide deacetylase family protein [Paucibacter sp. APW11]|uniref:Polysaccharide deacetylase family protein n=2 Tax=Roseateles aquae TaxID=3077235 RepID=A0ABU3P5U0_9BURK|nr:polysaccharide deacetylase family protein [Paucibacter sp. APW11]
MPVLIFHRVHARPDPLFPGEVDAARFDQLCGWLRRWFHVLPLDEAVRLQKQGALPARAAAITFDDGYADNHDVAMPILQRHGISACFFIASGFLDGGCMWNDRVIEAVRRSKLPSLDLRELSEGLLGVYPLENIEARRAAIQAIIGKAKYLPVQKRLDLVDAVLRAAGVALPRDLMMSSEQVRLMRRGGMQIGAHTLSHPILAGLDAAAATAEIDGSRQQLQGLLDERIGLFAYPNGKLGSDYSAESVELVRRLGFDAAVSTHPGVFGAKADLFQIPRFTPWESDKLRFGLRLAQTMARS